MPAPRQGHDTALSGRLSPLLSPQGENAAQWACRGLETRPIQAAALLLTARGWGLLRRGKSARAGIPSTSKDRKPSISCQVVVGIREYVGFALLLN